MKTRTGTVDSAYTNLGGAGARSDKLNPNFESFIEVNSNGGNADGDFNSLYDSTATGTTGDTSENTLADIAMHFYERDLHPGIANEVPPIEYVDPNNGITYMDDNPAQHLVTYIIGFSSAAEENLGFIPQLNALPVDHINAPPLPWPLIDTSPLRMDNLYRQNRHEPDEERALINDLRHAAFNSRGLFLSAGDAQSLNTTLRLIIEQIRGRAGLSGSAIAQNSTVIRNTSRIFQASFNSGEWSGELIASSLTSQGELDQEVWRASNTFPTVTSANDRNIYTGIWAGGAFNGVRFTDTPIPPGLLFTLPTGTISTNDIIKYIAGVQSREGTGANDFRQRETLLGDIVSSSPISVGYVDYNYGGLRGNGRARRRKLSRLSRTKAFSLYRWRRRTPNRRLCRVK